VEGKTIALEGRYAQDRPERLRELAADLVRLKVDVIVSAGPIVTRAAKEATATIPIVMAFDVDPVGSGFAASLAHPGGNITGLSNLAPEIIGKQLGFLKEINPKLSRVAILGNSGLPGNANSLSAVETAAKSYGVAAQYLDVRLPEDIEAAFRAADKERADAVLITVSGTVFLSRRAQILGFAAVSRRPVMYSGREFVDDGGLIAYGVSYDDLFRRAATYVDKILKGAKPGDLPIEQATKFELVINLKTARTLGITIPQSMLLRADDLIQ
jgi:putative ABC transport system substrate-binding protein